MKPVEILLIEDNEGDILLIEEALEEGRIVNRLQVLRDGEAAIQYLRKQGAYARAILPDLILLDINLPKKNGHEVLQAIKTHPDTRRIPVVMLTTSSSDEDILKSYDHYANCFITKPVDVGNFLGAVNQIEEFWLQLVRLPKM
jgi:CheY-like chemotaxis protein